MQVFSDEIHDGRYSLHAVTIVSGDGIQVYLGGGEKPHIGSVAISQPRKSLTGDGSTSCTTSVLNLVGHKDDALSVTVAESICRAVDRVAVVTAGVHITAAGSSEIDHLLENARQLTERIILRLQEADIQAE
jgi:hypothetical protein